MAAVVVLEHDFEAVRRRVRRVVLLVERPERRLGHDDAPVVASRLARRSWA